MKRNHCIGIIILLVLVSVLPVRAMGPVPHRATATPIVLPYLIDGESIAIENLVLDFNISNKKKRLTQTIYLNNLSNEPQQALIAIPSFSTIHNYVNDTPAIKLNGNTVDQQMRLVDPWIEEYAETVNYQEIMAVSIQDRFDQLPWAASYALTSYNDQAPLSGYTYEIMGNEEGYVNLQLTYDPAETVLLIDPSTAQGNSSGECLAQNAGEVVIKFPVKEDESRICRVLILGKEDVEYKLLDSESSSESTAAGDNIYVK